MTPALNLSDEPGVVRHRPSAVQTFLRASGWVLAVFALSRLLVFGVMFLSKLIVVRGPYWHPGGLLEVFTQWDGVWYLHIARHGYFFTPETRGTVAFFPTYPLLVRALSVVIHDFRLAAVLVSNGCLLGAGFLLRALVAEDDSDPRAGRAAVTLLMFSPVSFFFSSAYTESTFLLLALGAFLAARRGAWLWAGLCGFGLAATRNVGFWIAVPLLLEYLRQTARPGQPLAGLWQPRVLLLGLAPLGLVAFMAFGRWRGGDWLAFSHAGADWGRILVPPWRTLATAQFNPPFYQWLFLGALGTGLLLHAAGWWMRLRLGYLTWSALLIFTYLCSNSLEGMPRYLSVVFPLFIVSGRLASRAEWAYTGLLAGSVALLTVCSILSANGYWMT